jgi:predicted O-methyltransferase YrrM
MLAALARLMVSRDPGARPVRRALMPTVFGRPRADEAHWIELIEGRRAELATGELPTGMPAFRPAADGAVIHSVGAPETTTGFAATVMSLSPRCCLLLMRLVRERRPASCLELGTGFGISTAYQAAALSLNGRGRLTTLEGAAPWSELALEGLDKLGLDGVSSRVGQLSELVAEEAARCEPLDFVFIDAEHQEEPTVAHFEAILPHLADEALVVLDDVDWPAVRAGFTRIAADGRVSTAVVLGRLGVCSVRRS